MIKLIDIYRQLFVEAIDCSVAKEYVSIKRNPEIIKQMDFIFNNLIKFKNSTFSKRKDRIYIPFEKDSNKDISKENPIENEIENVLSVNNYKLVDYLKGITLDPYGREMKIGKVLNKIKNPSLLQKFNTDKSRESKSNINSYLCFSRHPYDIAGASTDRGWNSCMNVYTGTHYSYVKSDIKEGTIVCYLISSNDMNITNPIARVLIKPFINIIDSADVIYGTETEIYGTAPANFLKQITSILDKIQHEKSGIFKLNSKLYKDSTGEIITGNVKKLKSKKEVEIILNRFNIENYYSIDSNLSVDIKYDVNIKDTELINIPVQFNKVGGDFNCSRNKLASLEGCPKEVGGEFSCSKNNLYSLKHAPVKVGGGFFCAYNKLNSLQGVPKEIYGNFFCSYNELSSLKYAPTKVNRDVDCSFNKLISLVGSPEEIGGDFDCSDNQLITLKGAPIKVNGNFYCSNNTTKFTIEDVKKVCKVNGNIIV